MTTQTTPESGTTEKTTRKESTALIQGKPVITDTDQLHRIATSLSRSAMCPDAYRNKPNDCFVAILAGAEVGLQAMQSLKNIAVIKGRPTIWGDGLSAIALHSGKMKSFEERFDGTPFENDYTHVIRVERNDIAGVREFRFSVADAKRAKLWGKTGPWTEYPQRMLMMRNRAYAYRDVFADAMCGFVVAEEQRDIDTHHSLPAPQEMPPEHLIQFDDDDGPTDDVPFREPEEDIIDAETEPVEEPPAKKAAKGQLFDEPPKRSATFKRLSKKLENAESVDEVNEVMDEVAANSAMKEIEQDEYEELAAACKAKGSQF